MPVVNGPMWRECREEIDITSDQAAWLFGITGGALRQIELGSKPASKKLADKAARLYKVDADDLFLAGGQPDQPKNDPKRVEPKVEPTAPPARRNGKHDGRGPRKAVAS